MFNITKNSTLGILSSYFISTYIIQAHCILTFVINIEE